MLVAVTVLAISLSVLLYHHPPSTWSSFFPAAAGPPESTPKSEARSSQTGREEAASAQVPEDQTQHETRDSPSPQTTPKAAPRGSPRNAPAIPSLTLAADDSSDDEAEDNLPPPSFPAMNSAQRASAARPAPLPSPQPPSLMAPPPKPASMAPPPRPASSLMPPPPRIVPSNLRALPTASQSLHVPSSGPLPQRGPIPNRGPPVSNGSLGPPPTGPTVKTPNARGKVLLSPGHSPLDWANLQRSGKNLSGVPAMIRVTPSMLKHNNGRKGKPAWSSYQGKVYNITPYLPFHPGGEGELKRAAGKDGTKLFMEVHPWVNWENMLGECLVGIAVSEELVQSDTAGSLEDMD